MTVSTELQRMKTAIDNAYSAAEAKGATIPEIESSENLATTILSITSSIQSLNITPSTSAQTFIPSDIDGYGPVNVSAVTSSIDANIVEGNIKDGVSILGVTGTLKSGDEITATNITGSAVSADDRVWVNGENVYTQNFTQSGGTVDITNQTFTTDTNNAYISNTLSTALSDNMTFEICLKLKKVTLQTTTGNYEYYASFGNTTSLDGMGFFLSRAPSSNKNTSPKWSNMGIFAVPTNQFFEDIWYWLKAVVINGVCTTYYSLDGETFTQVATGTPTYTTLNGTGCFIGYKQYSGGDNNDVVYDLSECYVKVDGNIVWTPYTKTGTNYSIINDTDITSTSFTGIAQETIANNATGSVKTLLDGNGTYAPTLGTKTITANGTYTASAENAYGLSEVTVNVPSAPTKKYNLLNRVKDDSNNEIGTVSGFFTDANDVEYAVVCLDAQYRLSGSKNGGSANIPEYYNQSLWEAKETATYNTDAIIATGDTSICTTIRSHTFVIDGITYAGQLPNIIELVDIYKNRTSINNLDISGTIPQNEDCWSSTKRSGSYFYQVQSSGQIFGVTSTNYSFAIPVLEIPNT